MDHIVEETRTRWVDIQLRCGRYISLVFGSMAGCGAGEN